MNGASNMTLRLQSGSRLIWVALLASTFACNAHAATELRLGISSGAAGQTLTVPLDFSSTDGATALQFDVQYDPAKVEILGIQLSATATAHTLDFEVLAPGLLRCVVVSFTNAALPNTELIHFSVRLLQEVAQGQRGISFNNMLFSDQAGTDVAVFWAPFIRITAPASGSWVSGGTNLSVSAVAVSYEGTVSSVQFKVGDQNIGVDSSAPFSINWTASGAGQVLLTAVAIGSNGRSSVSPAVFIGVGVSPISQWLAANFTVAERSNPAISGYLADADGDGIPNLMEYALGLDPRAIDDSGLPELGTVRIGEQVFATLTYRANPDAVDLEFTVQASSNGTTWMSGPGHVVEMENFIDAGKRVVVTRDTVDATTFVFSSRFMRLTVEPLGD